MLLRLLIIYSIALRRSTHTLLCDGAHQVASDKLLLSFGAAALASACNHACGDALAPARSGSACGTPALPLLLCERVYEDTNDTCGEDDLNHRRVEKRYGQTGHDGQNP